MTDLDTQIRDLAAQRHLPNSHLERWLAFDEAGRAAFLELAQTLRLRTGQIVVALDLIDEIAVREGIDTASLLSRPPVRRLLDGTGSAPERAHAFLSELRALRFPRLREMTTQLEAVIAELRLPSGIAVLLPHELASDELTIQLKVSDARELERLLDIVMEKRNELARILAMLGGDDEV